MWCEATFYLHDSRIWMNIAPAKLVSKKKPTKSFKHHVHRINTFHHVLMKVPKESVGKSLPYSHDSWQSWRDLCGGIHFRAPNDLMFPLELLFFAKFDFGGIPDSASNNDDFQLTIWRRYSKNWNFEHFRTNDNDIILICLWRITQIIVPFQLPPFDFHFKKHMDLPSHGGPRTFLCAPGTLLAIGGRGGQLPFLMEEMLIVKPTWSWWSWWSY